MTINSEVFPDPDGPTTATASPAPISRLTPRRISTGPARLASLNLTSAREMIGAAVAGTKSLRSLCQWSRLSTWKSVDRTVNRTGGDFMKRRTAARALGQVSMLAVLVNACLILMSGASHAEAQSDPIRIVAFGDSLTAEYGLPPGEAFPAQLEKALQEKGLAIEVINAGVSGDTTAAGLQRFDWAFPDDADAAIVALGANDALRGIDPAETRRNLDEILTRLDARGVPVLIAGMRAPRNWGDDYVMRFDAIFP